MALFGIGAAAPLLLLGLASRQSVNRARAKLLATGRLGRILLGAMLLLLGLMILSGADKLLEAFSGATNSSTSGVAFGSTSGHEKENPD